MNERYILGIVAQTALVISPTRSRTIDWKVIALLFGSVTFVLNATVAIHELGHVVLDRLYGLDASLVLDPFSGSYTVLAQPWPTDMSVWPVAAGPLANIVLGVLFFLGLFSWRSPYLLPFMLWGPIAFLQEWTTALVQLGTREEGTDWILINNAGLASGLIVGLAVSGVIAGLAGLYVLLPVAGLAPEMPPLARLGALALGMGGFSGLILGVSVVLHGSGVETSRNLRLTLFVVLIAILLAMTYPAFARIRRVEVMAVPLAAVWNSLALACAVFLLFLIV